MDAAHREEEAADDGPAPVASWCRAGTGSVALDERGGRHGSPHPDLDHPGDGAGDDLGHRAVVHRGRSLDLDVPLVDLHEPVRVAHRHEPRIDLLLDHVVCPGTHFHQVAAADDPYETPVVVDDRQALDPG